MRAVRYYGIQDVRFEEVDIPRPQEGEVLIRTSYAGICGSDLHIYNKQMFIQNIPETMGHEFAGTIEALGPGVDNFSVGDQVTAVPMVTCGECPGCLSGYPNTCSSLGFIGEVRPGCFAEYIVMPTEDLVLLPKESNLRDMVLVEPLAVALNLCELGELEKHKKIAILGAGPIGLLTLLLAKQYYHVETADVVGRSGFRLDLAKQMGADHVLNALEEDSGYDLVLEAAGKQQTLAQAVASTKPNGTIVIVSVFEDTFPFDWNDVVVKQLRLVGASAYEKRHMEKAAQLISQGQVDLSGMITSAFPPEACKEAFERASSKEKKDAKIIFDFTEI